METFGLPPLDRSRKRVVSRSAMLRCGIPARFLELPWAAFQERSTWRAVVTYILSMDQVFQRGTSMLLCGEPWTGKSANAALIAKTFREYDQDVRFASAYQIHADIEERAYDKEDDISLAETYRSVPFLVVDDLGGEAPLTRRASHVPQLVADRIAAKRPTVITTALSSESDFDALGIYQRGMFARLNAALIVVPCVDQMPSTSEAPDGY